MNIIIGVNMKIKLLIFVALFISCSENVLEQSFEREPADQEIKILYKHWFNDEVDTFNKILTKDLVIDGEITIDFWFQKSEQSRIIDMVEQIDFWTIRDTLDQNPLDSPHIEFDPDPGIQELKIEYLNNSKTVYWYLINDYEDETARIKKLTDLIVEIIYNDPEYKNLPARNGSYF